MAKKKNQEPELTPDAEKLPMLDRKVREVEMELACDLTAEQKVEITKDLVGAYDELTAHQEDAKAQKEELKSTETKLEAKISTLVSKLRNGTELREVKVDQVFDLETNSYWEIRKDTNQEIPGSKRALEMSERQREFNLKLDPEQAKQNDVSLTTSVGSEQTGDPIEFASVSELQGRMATVSGKAG